jgi:hypothetical protein
MSWRTPEHLPVGRSQAGDRHLKFHKTGDKLDQPIAEKNFGAKAADIYACGLGWEW